MQRVVRSAALALSMLLPLVVTGTAHADQLTPREQTIVLAHPEVRGLLRHDDYRVLTGVQPAGTSWIAIEKLENDVPAWQYWMHNAKWGSWNLSVGYDLGDIRLDWYRGGIVAFTALHQRRDWIQCRIDTRGSQWEAVCWGNYTGPVAQPQPPAPPAPPPPRWSTDPQVIGACERAFVSSAAEQACLQALAYYRYNPSSVVTACDTATVSDEQGLECVRSAGAAGSDPSSVVAACDTATVSDAAVVACVAAAVDLAGDPLEAISTCDRTMTGEDNKVACIQRAPHIP